jgi:hypothetical protein
MSFELNTANVFGFMCFVNFALFLMYSDLSIRSYFMLSVLRHQDRNLLRTSLDLVEISCEEGWNLKQNLSTNRYLLQIHLQDVPL